MAGLQKHLQDVNPNKFFAVVPLPHAATTDIFVRQLQALVTPGTQIMDDLVGGLIWWFNTHKRNQGGLWVPHLGWADTLIAPPTDPGPAPSTVGGEQTALPPKPSTSHCTKTGQNKKAGEPAIGGATSRAWWSGTRRRHAQRPNHAKVTPAPSP